MPTSWRNLASASGASFLSGCTTSDCRRKALRTSAEVQFCKKDASLSCLQLPQAVFHNYSNLRKNLMKSDLVYLSFIKQGLTIVDLLWSGLWDSPVARRGLRRSCDRLPRRVPAFPAHSGPTPRRGRRRPPASAKRGPSSMRTGRTFFRPTAAVTGGIGRSRLLFPHGSQPQ